MSNRLPSVLIAGLVLVGAALAQAAEPSGYGKATFGMSPEQVEKLYAGRIRRLDKENLGATPIYGPHIVRQVITDQKVPGLEQPTDVELRYWKGKLWVVIVYYGQNGAEAVTEALVKQYGKPSLGGQDAVWHGPKTMINTANRERWYALSDSALSTEVQAVFMEDMRKAQEKMNPPAAPAAPAPK